MLRGSLLWSIVASLCVMTAFATQPAVLSKVGEQLWSGKPSHPQTEKEKAFLSIWRGLDAHPAEPMRTVPFCITVAHPDPQIESISIENTSSSVIHNTWFFRQDMPNFYSAATIVESVTSGKKSETEKALALWALFPRYYYNYYPLHAGGLLYDPPTLFAVIGTAQCNYAATVLSTLCQMAGCRTHILGVQGSSPSGTIAHCVMEALADGRWIYLDPDGHSAYRRPDGDWAAASDLRYDPDLVRSSPHAYYDPSALSDAFKNGEIFVYEGEQDKFELAERQTDPAHYSAYRHLMRYDLLPNANTTIYPRRKGRYFGMELPIYCNGTLKWSYRSKDFSTGACSGTLAENLSMHERGDGLLLRPEKKGKPASLVLPLTSPYLMVGGSITAHVETSEDTPVYVLPFSRTARIEPEGWVQVGALCRNSSFSFDPMFQIEPLFGYALRIDVPASGLLVRALEVRTWLQCAPRALPYLTAGENQLLLYAPYETFVLPAAEPADNTRSVTFGNGLRISFALARSGNERIRSPSSVR